MSGQASYDVYVKKGVDPMGRDEFGEPVAHFVERENAVVLKRQLVARGGRFASRRASCTAFPKRRRKAGTRTTIRYRSTVFRRIKALRKGHPKTHRTRR